ncbi:MAG: hypothetical protein RBR01_03335, partial [Desulfobacterales bacterium]|nr:hypothetical protein [Desulfobacterales bacterium]
MKKWRLIAGILLVFILGLVVGSWGTGMYLRNRLDRFRENPETRKTSIMDRLNRRLGLTDAQRSAFESIVNETEQKVGKSFEKHEAEMKGFIEESFAQMARILSPEQRKKLDALRQELEKRRKAWENKPGGR